MGNVAKKRTGERLKLVTFQSLDALKDLINKGYLECNEKYIDLRKAGATYSWVLEKMDEKIEGKMNAIRHVALLTDQVVAKIYIWNSFSSPQYIIAYHPA